MCMSKDAKVAIVYTTNEELLMMKACENIVREFEVEVEVVKLSLFTRPDEVVEFSRNVEEKGFDVVIVGESSGNQLSSIVASYAPVPVISVPVNFEGHVKTQMPVGVPVVNVGKNSSINAGILAVQMLSIAYHDLRHKIIDYKEGLKNS